MQAAGGHVQLMVTQKQHVVTVSPHCQLRGGGELTRVLDPLYPRFICSQYRTASYMSGYARPRWTNGTRPGRLEGKWAGGLTDFQRLFVAVQCALDVLKMCSQVTLRHTKHHGLARVTLELNRDVPTIPEGRDSAAIPSAVAGLDNLATETGFCTN